MDGDGTIYTHNQNIASQEIIDSIISMLKKGLCFGLVTAAGYPGKAERYEERLELLLAAMYKEFVRPDGTCDDVLQRFFVLGGECNYFLRPYVEARKEAPGRLRLAFVPDADWKTDVLKEWDGDDITAMLDKTSKALAEATQRLQLPVDTIRKERAIGIIPREPTTVEVLEEVVLSVHYELNDSSIPFTAFNSKDDVWLDIGSKGHGIQCMRKLFGIASASQV
eukprot:gene8995-10658_t